MTFKLNSDSTTASKRSLVPPNTTGPEPDTWLPAFAGYCVEMLARIPPASDSITEPWDLLGWLPTLTTAPTAAPQAKPLRRWNLRLEVEDVYDDETNPDGNPYSVPMESDL